MTGRGLGNCGAGAADGNVIESETRRGGFGLGRGLRRIAGTNPEGGGIGQGRRGRFAGEVGRGRGHGGGRGQGRRFGGRVGSGRSGGSR